MEKIRIAWWNLENLFDHENAQRDPELAATLRSELRGWTAAVRNRKLDQLASVITQMFDGDGPDVLGVCEVENERVLQMLVDRLAIPGRDYRVLNHDSHDTRGIDLSFVYDANIADVTEQGHQSIVKRTATRDLFWADFRVNPTGGHFVALANHWPARSAGQYESEPFRMLTGETVSYRLDQLMAADNKRPILLMGDFNDEPFNRSMQEYLLGTRDRETVMRARTPRVQNLMWPLLAGKHPGTLRYETDWNMLDQFLASKGMLNTSSKVFVDPATVAIFRPSNMLGSAGAPRRFGRPATKLDPDGFSDHFPIQVMLRSR